MCAPYKHPDTQRRLVISFHDVSPSSQPVYDALYRELAELGYEHVCLLVVPRWHGTAPFTEDPSFCRWLHQLEAHGCEICLHGWIHRCDTAPTRPLSAFMRRLYTDNESEFYDLNPAQARDRIQQGLACMRKAGFTPGGFVAPAWLYGKGLQEILPSLGLTYTTRLHHILPVGAPPIYAPTLSLSSRNRWRRKAAGYWARFWPFWHSRTPIVRLAIHPGDLHYTALHNHLIKALKKLSHNRTAVTYHALLKELDSAS